MTVVDEEEGHQKMTMYCSVAPGWMWGRTTEQGAIAMMKVAEPAPPSAGHDHKLHHCASQ
jgi:hypothetical protein